MKQLIAFFSVLFAFSTPSGKEIPVYTSDNLFKNLFQEGKDDFRKKHVVCSMCDLACSLEAHVRDGQLGKLKGYADNLMMPNILCCKPVNAVEWYYNEHRLKYPLKRSGERGGGQWTRISWDQAMDEIAAKLQQVVDKHGTETFACSTSDYNTQVGSGMPRRFMNLLGSPNYISGVSLCMGNTAAVNSMTCVLLSDARELFDPEQGLCPTCTAAGIAG